MLLPHMFAKIYVLTLSLLLFAYAAVSVRLGLGRPGIDDSAKFCAMWLCPEEFSGARVARLLQESAKQPSDPAIQDLKRALEADSASAYAWADLGDALANANDSGKAKYCFERAAVAGPKDPLILFRTANFFFRTGDNSRTMTTFAAILRNPDFTDYYTPTFLTFRRMGLPIQTLLQNAIPPKRVPAQAFLRFLTNGNRLEDAEEVWTWTLKRGLVDEQLTADYLAFLIRQKQETQAAETWGEINAGVFPGYRKTNWLFNGNFEKQPKPGAFDWRFETNTSVQIEADNGVLKLVFAGKENVDFHGVSQAAVLSPGQWMVNGFIQTQDITTDQGVSLRVSGDGLDARTGTMTGTQSWTEVKQTFEIRPNMSTLVRVEVERPASRHFDNKISGTAWVRKIELAPVR